MTWTIILAVLYLLFQLWHRRWFSKLLSANWSKKAYIRCFYLESCPIYLPLVETRISSKRWGLCAAAAAETCSK